MRTFAKKFPIDYKKIPNHNPFKSNRFNQKIFFKPTRYFSAPLKVTCMTLACLVATILLLIPKPIKRGLKKFSC